MKFEGLQEDVSFNEKLKYVFKQIRLHWRNPYWWKGRFMTYIVNTYWKRKYPKDKIVSIMQEDWDYLIILDSSQKFTGNAITEFQEVQAQSNF